MIPGRKGGRLGGPLGLRHIAGVVVLATAVGAAFVGASRQEDTFPHDRHQRLFPLCTGCHEGIPTGDQALFFPTPESCAGCHNGEDQVRVAWNGPDPRVDNLKFRHDDHAAILDGMGDPAQSCQSCHVPAGAGRMEVSSRIQLNTCFSCHAHQAESHRVDARCATCHVPLAQSGLPRTRIEAMRAPRDHEGEGFLLGGHGTLATENLARCATCHTADRCVSCHVDTDRPEIAGLAFAPAGMDLPPAVAHYDEPASHTDAAWLGKHGITASRDACATCHTSDDCVSCHIAPLPAVVATLPARADVVAPGVGVEPHAPDSHEGFFFMEVHSVLAAGDPSSCNTCHVETFCVECHEGPVGGGYHPAGFVARHAADAFGREAECANCHDTQEFCRSCHVQAGLASLGRLGPGYHEGGGTWLLRHGQAARQNLESCTSCHKQNDCTQCHGVLGAFKVSPHTRDFDAQRAWEQSPRTCFACHIKNPLEGRAP